MEFTKPLFLKMRCLSEEVLGTIINAMWPDTPTFDDEADINIARAKAKKFFQSYRCYLNNDLVQYTDIIVKQFKKQKCVLNFYFILLLNINYIFS